MRASDLIEEILLQSLNDYMKKNKLVISKVEPGALANQSEFSNGLTITMDDGKMVEILIYESE
ncbi:hypothetical protein [Legionella quinlivanii]|uniref:hypothetical protein n=1 Tax=Legionella quinlivanii TaxID=45073 RepID=UPI002242DC35|nr:hypothetical protein [Legionella quinlivanii]MCW8452585.1 hypothetical protein [Legionella quinlivanii]